MIDPASKTIHGYPAAEAFALVWVDDDETAEEINITIEQSGGVALCLYGEFIGWAPDHSSVDEAIDWATREVSGYAGADVDSISTVRDPDWPHRQEVGFREGSD